MFLHLFFINILAVVFAAAPPAATVQAATSLNNIVAIVNDEPITILEVEQGAARLREQDADLSEQAAKEQMLNELIERRVMLQRAAFAGIVISDAVVDARLGELAAENNLAGEAALEKFAQKEFGQTLAEFRRRVREELTMQSLFYNEVFQFTKVTEAELRQFLQTQTDAGIKRRYRLGHIVINAGGDIAAARKRAETARARAAGGESFADVAAEMSDREVWDLGFKSGEELPDLFAAEAQNLKVGETGRIIETPSAFHIVKLLDATEGGLRDTVRRARLQHIFFAPGGESKAAAAQKFLTDGGADGAAFAEAAAEFSEDPNSAERGGDLGWFSEEEIPAYFVAALAGLEEGGISPPVESPFGLHILRLAERRVDTFDMEAFRNRAERLLRQRNALAKRDAWLQGLRSNAYVRILNPDFLPL